MEKAACIHAADVSYWDGYSQWYQSWYEHNDYHHGILETLMEMVRPGWKVLDIGAGNGVLSLPLCAIGCEVRALEPSAGMRNLLHQETAKRDIHWIRVDHRRWEDISDCPELVIDRLKHYFLTYKDLPGQEKRVEITHTFGVEEAHEIINRAGDDYRRRFENLEILLREV